MPSRKASRAMTYTGCWTCKARKVRCDERPIACNNCERRGISCSGYGIRLRWVSDSIAETDSGPELQGRRSIKLDQNCYTYKTEAIDKFISDIDQDAESWLPSRHGPFSAFPATATQVEPAQIDTPDTQYELLSWAIATREAHSAENSDWMQPVAQVIHSETPHPIAAGSAPDTILWSPLNPANSSSTLFPTPEDMPMDINIINELSTSEDQPEEEEDLVARYNNVEGGDQDPPTPETSLALYGNHQNIVHPVHTTLFGDPQIDYLMRHYSIHVARLLLPVNHSGNPFRTLYLSTAIEGILQRNLHTGTSRKMAYTALYQSLLASAAYHRWQCDQQHLMYRELGAKYRYHATRSLQAAVREDPPTANYQVLMLAILSLVTIGVLSGEGDDFRAHIQAAKQLRHLRSRWNLVSRPSRQLNELGAFLTLLSHSMSFEPSPSPWGTNGDAIVAEDMFLQSSKCYEYVYGVTPSIALAINETSYLAQHLTRFRQKKDSLPDDFLEACEELGNKLQSWRLETEDITAFSSGDDPSLSIFTHHAKAWHGAALIYYCTRIQGVERVDLRRGADNIAQHLHAAEDIKSASETPWQGNSMAPITWPAFVASCNVMKDRRGVWRRWWERMLGYKLGNMRKQWDIVRQIWEVLDIAGNEGRCLSWTEAYDIVGIDVLPV